MARRSLLHHLRRERTSFGHALRGLWQALKQEQHLRIHAIATILVLGIAIWLPLSRIDWALLTVAIGMVWAAELVNTAIERLTDLASPDFHPLAGQAKDVAAAAVLVTAIAAAVVGLLILGPPLWAWWQAR